MIRNEKTITMKKTLLISILFIFANANAQDDKFLDFQSAKIAFEKYNDCTEAEKLMKPIYNDFKEDLSFIHLYAKILKCLNKNKEALTVLQTYNAVAQDPSVDEEIAELNYKLKANNLTGQWTVTSCKNQSTLYSEELNLNDKDKYLSTDFVIKHTANSIMITNSYFSETGSATLVSEDENYMKFTGSYNVTYNMYRWVNGNRESDGNKTITWDKIYFTYNKMSKELKFDIPLFGVAYNNSIYRNDNYPWQITIKRK